MAAPTIGAVWSGSGKRASVAWSSFDKDVYVYWGRWIYVGKAYSAKEAMTKAETWLYNK